MLDIVAADEEEAAAGVERRRLDDGKAAADRAPLTRREAKAPGRDRKAADQREDEAKGRKGLEKYGSVHSPVPASRRRGILVPHA